MLSQDLQLPRLRLLCVSLSQAYCFLFPTGLETSLLVFSSLNRVIIQFNRELTFCCLQVPFVKHEAVNIFLNPV